MQWDDINFDLTASFRRFREQVLDAPSSGWTTTSGMDKFFSSSMNIYILINFNRDTTDKSFQFNFLGP
jgi:hypothetical protein